MSGTSTEFVSNYTGVFRRVLRPYRTNYTRTPGSVVEGIALPGVYLGGRTKVTKMSDTGIEVVPNLADVSGIGIEAVPNLAEMSVAVARPYRRYSIRKNMRTFADPTKSSH